MNRIRLATNDIFTQNGQRIKVLIEGIDLEERFNENPIMLFNHDTDKVLGKWISIEVDETAISAVPDFDEDEFSVDIGNKIKRGTLKFASVGLDIIDAFLEGEVLVISKSTLIESSIAGIPANTKAKKVDFKKNTIMLFSNGKELNTNEYIQKLNSMKVKNDPKVKGLEEVIEKAKDEVKTDVKAKKEDKKESVKEVIEKVEVKEVKPTELETLKLTLETKNSELNKVTEDLKATKLELNLEIKGLNAEIAVGVDALKASEKDVEDKVSTIVELKASIDGLNAEKMETLLDFAVEEGKITKEAKEDFLELSFEKAKSILNKIIPKEVSLASTLQLSKSESGDFKNYDWYLKNDKEGLRKLSKENPALYKQLEAKR